MEDRDSTALAESDEVTIVSVEPLVNATNNSGSF